MGSLDLTVLVNLRIQTTTYKAVSFRELLESLQEIFIFDYTNLQCLCCLYLRISHHKLWSCFTEVTISLPQRNLGPVSQLELINSAETSGCTISWILIRINVIPMIWISRFSDSLDSATKMWNLWASWAMYSRTTFESVQKYIWSILSSCSSLNILLIASHHWRTSVDRTICRLSSCIVVLAVPWSWYSTLWTWEDLLRRLMVLVLEVWWGPLCHVRLVLVKFPH